MAITYHAGRRIQGLSEPTFIDNLSTDKGWTTSNSSFLAYDGSLNELDWLVNQSVSQDNEIYLSVGTLNDEKFVARFQYDVDTATVNDGNLIELFIGMSDSTGVGSQDFIGMYHKYRSTLDQWGAIDDNSTSPLTNINGTSAGNITGNTGTYYCEIIRLSSTTYKITMYTNSDYSGIEWQTSTLTVDAGVTGLQYFKIMTNNNSISSGGNVLSGSVKNIAIANGVTTMPDYDTKPTNVQVGSRYEETDTRKMYHKGYEYKVHSFTSSGTFAVTGSGDVEYLVVAGGGGGGQDDYSGGRASGGGGAGGYRTATGFGVTAQSYSITVGAGGAGGTTDVGSNGSDSIFSSITSVGGGAGGGHDTGDTASANAGGSGGGAPNSGGSGSNIGGLGTAGQGNNGGNGQNGGLPSGGGGGGGAGAVGTNAGSGVSGAGGAGLSNSITGSSVTRAGGGGGGGKNSVAGAGGTGGGGAGSVSGNGTNGTTNTGSGGGAGAVAGNSGGNGGSGIVIIRYVNDGSITATGGTITTTDGAWTEEGT
jgi:hypothetical protein